MFYTYMMVPRRGAPFATGKEARGLQPWYKIELVREEDTVRVVFHSDIHVNKRVELPISFDSTFSDREILGDADLHRHISARWGNVLDGRYYAV